MIKQDVINVEKKKVGQVDLSEEVFGVKVKTALIHEAIKAILAGKRTGTSSTKTRAEVKCSNVKPYRQKGTGRARHGSWVSPLFVGGGITFGPKPRDFTLYLTKKKKVEALKSALSAKVKDNQLLIVDEWKETKKTKEMAAVLKKLGVRSAMIVLAGPTAWLERCVRNIPYINYTYVQNLNTHNVIAREHLVCTKDVVATLQEGLAK